MHIPSFWSKVESQARSPNGNEVHFACWGGSQTSVAEAQILARGVAERIASRIRRGEGFPERYAYGDRPLREEILGKIDGPLGDPTAVLTRNAYGVRVLNAAQALFIDVDLPAPAPFCALLRRMVRVLFRSRVAPPPDHFAAALAKLEKWLAGHPDWGVRVYRTRAGLRYLVTHAPFEPGSAQSEATMEYLGCDPQYVILCRAQQCFRARLSPKPWRCGISPPSVRFPWGSAAEERAMRSWEARYDSAIQGSATCSLLKILGSPRIDPAIAALVKLHDEDTRAESGLPLA